MMRKLTTLTAAAALGTALTVTACTTDDDATVDDTPAATGTTDMHGEHDGHGEHDAHADHDHAPDGGPPPEGIADAEDPQYAVGSEVILDTDHMPGMEGTTATVVGAFDTYTYSVTYTPTDGGDDVVDHRWVVQEELADVGGDRLDDGDTAVLEATHMSGMQGAEATVDSSTDETVYMVDFEADGMTMTNHKWVTESEILPAE